MWDCIVVGCPFGSVIAQRKNGPVQFHVFPNPSREPNRFHQWVAIINNPKLCKMNPINVYKSMRICRTHFAPDSYNGDCKRLQPGAIPTMYLRPIALVQPMDSVVDTPQGLLREQNKHQRKRHITWNNSTESDSDSGSKKTKMGLTTILSASDVEGDEYVDGMIEFNEEYLEEEDFEEGSLASDSRLSSVCGGEYIMTSFSGLINSELDTLKQVEILNEPPETLLNESSVPETYNRLPIEKGYEMLVREFASEASNEEAQYETINEMLENVTKNADSGNTNSQGVDSITQAYSRGFYSMGTVNNCLQSSNTRGI